MKIGAAAIALALALVCARSSSARADDLSAAEKTCLATCQAEVMTHQVSDCNSWRDRLPRPDLYSLCQDGYDLGVSAGCKGYCAATVNEAKIASLRLDACTFLRGTPPMDRMRSCQSGFTSAVKRAKDTSAAAARRLAHDERAADSEDEQVPAVPSDSAPKKKPITVKKAPEARNILEMAREEAQAAFLDQRATDL